MRFRKSILILFLLSFCFVASAAEKKKDFKGTAPIIVTNLLTEGMHSPMSIDTSEPRLSWQISSELNDVMQTSYHIIVASTLEKADNGEGDLWDATLDSDQSQWIKYEGKHIRSNTPCFWKVKVNTTKGESPWSDVAMWNVGLLTESDWTGQWIGFDGTMPWDIEDVHSRLSSRYFRKEFLIEKTIKRATLYISGLGLYEAYINGQKVGDDVLTPAPTDYRRTALFNAYDVTEMLSSGGNAIGVTLGNGRFYTMQQKKKAYKINNFGYPKLRANLIIEYLDGEKNIISTNTSWKLTLDGPIRSSNEYDGEVYDARKELGAWTLKGYDDSSWQEPERVAAPDGTLRGSMSPSMKVLKTMKPCSITPHDDGFIVDMGQNMAGWLKIRIADATAGDSVIICYAERLDEEGDLYRENFRNAISTDYYVPDGKEKGRWWSPKFVYHGFRYVKVLGLKTLNIDDVLGEVISDNMEQTGEFSSGDTILNKIFQNAHWGVLSNYKGMPVDCPQRDERQPWLGDRARGCFGEAYLFDNKNLYSKWARDIVEAQREDGCIPDVAPAYWNYYTDNITWPSALPFAMEMLYLQYGDDKPIKKYYDKVKLWLEHMKYQYGKDGLMPCDNYGDWCVPPEEETMIHSQDSTRTTDGTLIATAYYYRLCKLMEDFAKILSKKEDQETFQKEAERTKEAFNKEFLTINKGTAQVDDHLLYPDSTFYGNNTVTANLLPFVFGIATDDYVKEEIKKNIINNIITINKGSIPCGIIGVQWLMHALTDMGRGDIAWLLATNKTYPSWGYMTEKGATTIWELWNGDTADPAMNSGNHVMLLGDLISWIFEDVAGIKPDEKSPGFKHIIMAPDFSTDEIDDIDASYSSIYGKIVSNWKKVNGVLNWHVEIPCNTTAELHMPDGELKEIGSGVYDLEAPLKLPDEAIIVDEFLYKNASFPECHSATIAETDSGDLVATYFGGTKERNPDVAIWVSRKPKGSSSWTPPQMVADGVFSDTLRKACWNPVIYQVPGGELQIYFKIGEDVAQWTGWIVRSSDGGKTWTKREPLQEGFLGPVKNKPILSDGRLIAPTSIENDGWRLYFEYSDDMGKTWKRTDFVEADSSVLAIQPSIMKLKSGRLAALARTRSEHIGITYSEDNGLTWSKLRLIDTPNNNSGLDAITLKNGTQVLICNEKPIPHGIKNGKGLRTPLSLMISQDGETWHHWITLEDSPVSQYSYPSIIQTSDGHIHCIYTWRRQRIKHVELLDVDANSL